MNRLQAGTALRRSLWNIFGASLVFAGVALAAVNAQAVLQYAAAASAHGGMVVDLPAAAPPAAAEPARMVRVTGPLAVTGAARDAQFNLSVDTPLLTRRVEMFQWREVLVGDRVHYELDWEDRWIDASRFREPRGHANPPDFPLPGASFRAGGVQVGSLQISPVLQRALPGTVTVAPDVHTLPANLAATFSRHGDYLQTSARADNPQPGDVRVSWSAVPLGQVTVVAWLDDGHLRPAPDAADGQGYRLARGDVPLLDLLPDLAVAPSAEMFKRVLAVWLAALGALVLLTVQRRALSTTAFAPVPARWWSDALLALGLGALAVSAVAATLWAGNDVRRMAYWLVLALLAVALSLWQIYRRR